MLLNNTYTRTVCLTALILLIGGCAASSSAPVIASTPGSTYDCDANESDWECRARNGDSASNQTSNSRTTVASAESQRVPWWSIRVRGNDGLAPARQTRATQRTRTVANTESRSNTRRGFFNIRMRGSESVPQPTPVAEPAPTPSTAVAAVVEERNLNPTASRTPTAAPVQVQPTPTTTTVRPTATLSTRPINTPSRQVAQVPTNTRSVTPQAPAQRPTPVQRPQPVASPRPVVQQPTPVAAPAAGTMDGLGRDYDYAVQLGAFSNYSRSSDFMSSFPSLDLMRVKTASKGKTFYIVIAGTFENKQLAHAQSEMLASTYGLNDAYIRTVRSIRTAQVN